MQFYLIYMFQSIEREERCDCFWLFDILADTKLVCFNPLFYVMINNNRYMIIYIFSKNVMQSNQNESPS